MDRLNVLVIGSGGREHALARAIAQSPLVKQVFALPGNPGMQEAVCLPGNPQNIAQTVKTALDMRIDFCVVTPEDPLAAGLSDALRAAGIPCFGPSRAAARIESSKAFSKDLMRRHGIPTANHEVFEALEPAQAYAREMGCPLVIKADGLAKGKGVVIAQTPEEADSALSDMLLGHAFGDSGARVVIEEYLEGPEVSLLCLCDGDTILPLVSAMDHKRAWDGERGPNTGGMGAIAPNPFYTAAIARQVRDSILLPTLKAMRLEGCPFTGCLFVGLMLTRDGPKVLEYNARFGDPETQAVVPLIASDLFSHLLACERGTLAGEKLVLRDLSACCLVLASRGYPGLFETGCPITLDAPEAAVCFAGVGQEEGRLVTSGGRVLSLTALAEDLRQAVAAAYRAAERVAFDTKTCRLDIGQAALKELERR